MLIRPLKLLELGNVTDWNRKIVSRSSHHPNHVRDIYDVPKVLSDSLLDFETVCSIEQDLGPSVSSVQLSRHPFVSDRKRGFEKFFEISQNYSSAVIHLYKYCGKDDR